MNVTSIHTVAVLGAGIMGQGIARVCAAAGHSTLLYDISEAVVIRAIEAIQKDLQVAVDKGKMTPHDRDETQRNILPCSDLRKLKVDLVIEAG